MARMQSRTRELDSATATRELVTEGVDTEDSATDV
jgi:hypothetical protein